MNAREIAVATSQRPLELCFRPVDFDALPIINSFLQRECSRSCDYSIGGIYMWIDYFNYEYCIVADTLFIKGLSEDASRRPSFAVPIGSLPLGDAVDAVKAYCRRHGVEPLFSAVPDDKLDALCALGHSEVTPLDDWADYIYTATDLATLTGKHYNKKRNHVNRFMTDNPHWALEPLEGRALADADAFFAALAADSDDVMAEYERRQCADVLRHYDRYPFEGAVLRDESGAVVAFTAAEVIGDTLVIHIEKMDHEVAGAGETINKLFAAEMLHRHPGLRYINREDDAGDLGLRYAKESYHPLRLLRKFNVRFTD